MLIPYKQKGAATLLTAVMLILATTLVAITTGKTVLQETKITANSYRTAQANTAANAAMDYAVAYFQVSGLDQWHTADDEAGSDDIVDFPIDADTPTLASCSFTNATANHIVLGTGTDQTTLARFYFINTPTYDDDNDGSTAEIVNPCDAAGSLSSAGTNMNAGMVVAQGWSDDCSAVRTISQCITVGNGSILKGDGPEQPFISKGQVMVGGSATIINRYTNSTIWTGSSVGLTGAAIETYSRTADTDLATDFTDSNGNLEKSRLIESDESIDTQAMTNSKNGIGADVITGDPNIANNTDDEFFELFFKDMDGIADNSKAEIKALAGTQLLPAGSDLDGLNSLIWVEGTSTATSLNGGTIGTAEKPAILIVEGDLNLAGGTEIYGVIYVVGELFVAGTVTVTGSVITEVTGDATGNLTIIYTPFSSDGDPTMGSSTNPIAGTHTVVSGSWKDW